MSTNAPRNVAIATAGYQLAFWLAESEGCPPESGAECGGTLGRGIDAPRFEGKREKEREVEMERETKKERIARVGE